MIYIWLIYLVTGDVLEISKNDKMNIIIQMAKFQRKLSDFDQLDTFINDDHF